MVNKTILFLFSLFFILSCKKDSDELYIQTAKDVILGERLIVDVLQQVLYTSPNFLINEEDSVINGIKLSSQPELSDSAYPKTITIDYGSGIIGVLGKMRKGKIIVKVNSNQALTEDLAISFDEYSSDGSEVWGYINYMHNTVSKGYDGEILEDGISIINANGTMKLDGTFSFSKKSISGSSSLADNKYDFECNITGVDFKQTSFSYSTGSNHSIDFECIHYITSGTSLLTPHKKNSQTINFGSGKCDSNGVIESSDSSQKNFTF